MSPLFAWYWVSLRRGPTPPLQTPYTPPPGAASRVRRALDRRIVALGRGGVLGWPSVFAFGAVLIAAAVSVGLAGLLVTTIVAFVRERRRLGPLRQP